MLDTAPVRRMLDVEVFLKGVAIGFAMAIPVGPVALTCLRRSLTSGWRAGLESGLGAATADAIYALLSASALKAATQWWLREHLWLNVVGGLLLSVLGLRAMRGRDIGQIAGTGPEPSPQIRAYFSTLALALANPLTLVAFAALFASFDLASDTDYAHAAILAAGVLGGSTLWWALLAYVAERMRPYIRGRVMERINGVLGGALLAAGLLTIARHVLTRL